jgi:alkanesulfonate monooxygenase SsuD/methylene tetrahydromethanopterin reductase-like flavin-dependent oxidoreductase (luciferase family)
MRPARPVRIGIGLPAAIPGATGALVQAWARRAEAYGFDSLAVIDRVVYPSFEPLVALAAAAAVTERTALVTTVLVGPLRSTALLARQVASVQRLSGNRLVLGLGTGARADDYEAAGVPHSGRGSRLDSQLEELVDLVELGRFGPAAPMPPTLVGGLSTAALTRMARHADGYVHGGGPPGAFAKMVAQALSAWADADRPGAPQLWGQAYFAFGAGAGAGRDYLHDYYAFTGALAERIGDGLVRTRRQLLELAGAYREAGCDHLCLLPTVASLDQLEQVAEAREEVMLT